MCGKGVGDKYECDHWLQKKYYQHEQTWTKKILLLLFWGVYLSSVTSLNVWLIRKKAMCSCLSLMSKLKCCKKKSKKYRKQNKPTSVNVTAQIETLWQKEKNELEWHMSKCDKIQIVVPLHKLPMKMQIAIMKV